MSDVQKLAQYFLACGNADKNIRVEAEKAIQNLMKTDAALFYENIIALMGQAGSEVSNDEEQVLDLAGIVLRRKMAIYTDKHPFEDMTTARLEGIKSAMIKVMKESTNHLVIRRMGEAASFTLSELILDMEWPELYACLLHLATLPGSPRDDKLLATRRVVGIDGLVQLGDYLETLIQDETATQMLAKLFELGMDENTSTLILMGKSINFILVLACSLPSNKLVTAAAESKMPHVITLLKQGCERSGQCEGDWDEFLQNLLQSVNEAAMMRPKLFKGVLRDLLEILLVIMMKNDFDERARIDAATNVLVFSINKPKMCKKQIEDIFSRVLEAELKMMKDGFVEFDVEGWEKTETAGDDTEFDGQLVTSARDDFNYLMESFQDHSQLTFMGLIEKCLSGQQDDWTFAAAAMEALQQSVEYIDDEHMDMCVSVSLHNVQHFHARVRSAAWGSIAQMGVDKGQPLVEKHHVKFMEALGKTMSLDTSDRVKSSALSAGTCLCEKLDSVVMEFYARELMEQLCQLCSPQVSLLVRRESVTLMASVASVLGNGFEQYYSTVMPILKKCLDSANDSQFRGKVFECVTIVGTAVSLDIFRSDGKDAMEHMLKRLQGSKDVDQLESGYLLEALPRICECFKQEFADFVPVVLPIVVDVLESQNEGGDDDDEDEDCKTQHIKSAAVSSREEVASFLSVMIEQTKAQFYPYVIQTAGKLRKFLPIPDENETISKEERDEAIGEPLDTVMDCWVKLVESCLIYSKENGNEEGIRTAKSLFDVFMTRLLLTLQELIGEEDESADQGIRDCQEICEGIYGMLSAVQGTALLNIDTWTNLCQVFLHQTRRAAKLIVMAEDVQDDDDDEDDDGEDEGEDEGEQIFNTVSSFMDIIGALMEHDTKTFADRYLIHCADIVCDFVTLQNIYGSDKEEVKKLKKKLKKDVSAQTNLKNAGVQMASQMSAKLGELSVPMWPRYAEEIIKLLDHKNADIRHVASYWVNRSARLSAFEKAAEETEKRLVEVISGRKFAKKNLDSSTQAMDNMVSALFHLLANHSKSTNQKNWELVMKKLPLKADVDECIEIHTELLRLVENKHEGLLQNVSLPVIFGIFADSYKMDSYSNDELDEKLREKFRLLDKKLILQWHGELTEKQKKKIEKILS